jgi:flagellar L-ring protein precursor FlgH
MASTADGFATPHQTTRPSAKMKSHPQASRCCVAAATLLIVAGTNKASAQNSSMFQQDVPVSDQQLSLRNSSFLYQAPEPPRVIKLNDLITIIVDEKSQVSEQADVSRRKQYQLNATLKNWVTTTSDSIRLDPQNGGSPELNGTLQEQARASGNLQLNDGMKFRISARVVDIRPNGHLVLEAHQTLQNNEEKWERSISGIVRPEDILPNNSVLSEKLAELQIYKRERGMIRDSYRRGWFYKALDNFGAF